MKRLINELNALKKSKINKLVNERILEFENFQKASDEDIFPELCFCLLTANFQAQKSIKIQRDLQNHFHKLSEQELVLKLKEHGHRFPNMRAKFIFEARKHKAGIKKRLESFPNDFERREWFVKNVKGLGMKEASHFLRNIGYKNYAIIDFHIVDKLINSRAIERLEGKAITPKKYLEIENVLKELGEKTKLSQAELDLYLWYAETGSILK